MKWLWLIMHIPAIAGVCKAAWTIIPIIRIDWPVEAAVVASALSILVLLFVRGFLKCLADILEAKIADLDKR